MNPNRLVVGDWSGVRESLDGGATFTLLGSFQVGTTPNQAYFEDYTTGAVAIASFQGVFQFDPDFPLVTDQRDTRTTTTRSSRTTGSPSG